MNLHHLKYLVVDDMELMRAVTLNQLRSNGFERVKAARNGAEALEMLKNGKFDAILSDWNMPVMSGLQLLKAVRADAKLSKLPFLMITAEADRQRIEEVISAGVNALLVKPYNAGSLHSRLERMMTPQARTTLKPAPMEIIPETSAVLDEGRLPEGGLLPPRILVVDDHPVSLKLLQALFKDEYQVLTATDGPQAMAVCRTEPPPDLVLLDVMMPEMDGFEVVRQLRESPTTAQLPVIFVTGLTDDTARLRGMELGAVDFVSKNTDPKALRARVRNFIHFVELRRKLQADYDGMLEAARRREDADNMTRHDIKGSLAGIAGMVQILADDDTMAPKHVTQLRLVQQTAKQAMEMVDLAGELYKMEMGRFKLKAIAVDIGEILHRIVDLSRASFEHKRLTIEVDTDSAVGTELPQVLGDAMLCYSLFQNLIKNACEAAPPNTRVTVTLQDESPLQITITNKSVVPREIRERFFEKYATSGKASGSGIGTYSALMLARAQQGELRMETSDSLVSTTLTVTLPRYSFDVTPPPG